MHQLQDPTLSDSQHQAITKLMSIEKLRDSFRCIRQLKGGFKGSSICHVEIPGEFGPQLISGRVNVENALCHSLQKRFTKAHGSPFQHGQLLEDVGILGFGPAAKAILEGNYQCPDDHADKYTKLFIDALQWPVTHPELVSSILSPDNFRMHWHRAKESTSSSISGLHFGHYKAAVQDNLLSHLHA